MVSKVAEGKEEAGRQVSRLLRLQRADRRRSLRTARSRCFAGRKEEMLHLALQLPEDLEQSKAAEAASASRPCARERSRQFNACERKIAVRFQIADRGRAADRWLLQTVRGPGRSSSHGSSRASCSRPCASARKRRRSGYSRSNLHDLLLAAPAGPRATMGLDPGLRTGVKVAVVDRTGKLLDTATVYPHVPRNDWEGALHALAGLPKHQCRSDQHRQRHGLARDGQARRGTDQAASASSSSRKIVVSEAGASVYSASELASREFPASMSACAARSRSRGACRIRWPSWSRSTRSRSAWGSTSTTSARRELARSLDAVVEDCVNAVGVDVNTASPALLARVSGLSATLAEAIVRYRDEHGAFAQPRSAQESAAPGREDLRAGGRLPAHPRTATIRWTARRCTRKPTRSSSASSPICAAPTAEVDGRRAGCCASSTPARYTDEQFGLPTVRDILRELEKPGRDPRPEFKTAAFQEGVGGSEGSAAGHAAGRGRHQRDQLRCVRGHRRAPGRPGAHVHAVAPIHQGPARAGEGGRRRQGQSAGGRSAARGALRSR